MRLNNVFIVVFAILVSSVVGCIAVQETKQPIRPVSSFDNVFSNIEKASIECKDSFPFVKMATEDTWRCDYGWTGEYTPMAFWLNYEHNPTEANLQKAVTITQRYADNYNKMYDSMNHGFYGMPFVMAYKNTGDEKWRTLGLMSADKLVSKFNKSLGVITHEQARGDQVIVDSMPNLELLLWAHNETGQPIYLYVAKMHTIAIIDNMFKTESDRLGAVWHARDWGTGKTYNPQADNDNVTWGRGQAWFLYGMWSMYEYTNDAKYLEAYRLALTFWTYNIKDGVIDNSIGGNTGVKDTSGTAIALVSLIRYSNLERDDRIMNVTGNDMLSALTGDAYLQDGRLLHGAYSSKSPEISDLELIWGDYYLLEAIHESGYNSS